jgi:pimeloyl-ACP methyl ester carboxylesterase
MSKPAPASAAAPNIRAGSRPTSIRTRLIWREPAAGEIPLLTEPVLFLIGENDHAKELAAKMPHAQVEVFEGVGHLIHLEAEQRFNESVLHFLNQGR